MVLVEKAGFGDFLRGPFHFPGSAISPKKNVAHGFPWRDVFQAIL
jgi:hypothetical protein